MKTTVQSGGLIYIAIMLVGLNCDAQYKCDITLGEFFNAIKGVRTERNDTLHFDNTLRYEKFADFDFESFKPVQGEIKNRESIEIGSDNANRIRQIILHYDNWTTSRMLVYPFKQFRILILQYETPNGYFFTPAVFLLSKTSRFMINIIPYDSEGGNLTTLSDKLRLGKLEDISAVAILDERLYPIQFMRIVKGYIRSSSTVKYVNGKSKVVDHEDLEIYYSPQSQKKLKIGPSSCFDEFIVGVPDLGMTVQPNGQEGLEQVPLWIHWGAHTYK